MFKIYELRYYKDIDIWRLTQRNKDKKAIRRIFDKDLEEEMKYLKEICKQNNAIFIKYSRTNNSIDLLINFPLKRKELDYYYKNKEFYETVDSFVSKIDNIYMFAKDIKSRLENGYKININLENNKAERIIEEKLVKASKGFYFFEVKFKDYNNINNNFKESFLKDWEFKKTSSPSIILKRISKYCNENGDLKEKFHNSWIPFYVGKSKELSIRLSQHIQKDKASKGTYALKLKLRKDKLSDLKFRVSFVEVSFTDRQYGLLSKIIENKIREEIPSICGK